MINIDELLSPISEDNICGEYLRYDLIYDQLRELRREDDPRLSQGIWQTELKKADWPEVERVCFYLLKTKTKDLQLAMWLLESLTVVHSFRGFNQGVLLLSALCEKFWDGVYPAIGENGALASRLAPFVFFAEKIQNRLALVPLVEAADGLPYGYSLSDWMLARRNFQLKNEKGITLKQLKKSVVSTSLDFFQNIDEALKLSIESLKKLDDFISEKCGNEAPSFHGVLEFLEDAKRVNAENLAEKQKQITEYAAKQAERKRAADQAAQEQNAPQGKKEDATLEHAYAVMMEIAAFLEKEQPQSPASTLLKMAAAIGKKNFQELLDINVRSGISVVNAISELHRALTANPEEIERKKPLQAAK
ncbi:MAG: type VI secretion system protein TssA [Holosporaceae bacterium]|jgi:type VI secretion system protein ImpA|nr:type VI secretion system protein TssA [Holosporaceae bacterium]